MIQFIANSSRLVNLLILICKMFFRLDVSGLYDKRNNKAVNELNLMYLYIGITNNQM